MANSLQFESQKLGIWYFTVAAILFGAQLLFGLLAAIQFLYPSFLFEILDFSITRIVHINALVVWLLYAMFLCRRWEPIIKGQYYFIKVMIPSSKLYKVLFLFYNKNYYLETFNPNVIWLQHYPNFHIGSYEK